MTQTLLAIDQGTTSSRAVLYSTSGRPLASAQKEVQQYFPKEGWVEHDAERIWQDVLTLCRQVIRESSVSIKQVVAIGITNQRETTVVWDKKTGKPIHRAIVWQDRRTADFCAKLVADGLEEKIRLKTGLLIDPYFSATKIKWLLENIPAAKKQAEKGQLAFGTIDSFLLWHLTGGKIHASDATNAARTLLFNIHQQQWDEELLREFDIPAVILPRVANTADDFGVTLPEHFGQAIAINALVGDQQAALVGQACLQPGMVKSTYGTGCFMMMNTGKKVVESKNRLLSTVAYRLNNEVTYALEGSIFVAGAAVQWLRDALNFIAHAGESESIALTTTDTGGVYLVPAFTGMGAPYWDPKARGAILGLTRDSGVNHIVRAALESVCYQSRDLLQAMQKDSEEAIINLRVDGGMVANNWLMQFLADILNLRIDRPAVLETTSLGAAMLAGLQAGLFSSLEQLPTLWHNEQSFSATMPSQRRDNLYQGWLQAVEKIIDADSHHARRKN